ncbi:hypothetical protein N182_37935 [Sinorhizobium sp. GL2]|nr:hypothetical protein N182_37935 [Sinorhizobium sp. GL2]
MLRSDQENVASAAELVAQFKTAQRQLVGLVDEYGTEQFRLLEHHMSQMFAAIGRHEPTDGTQFRTLALLQFDDGGYNKHLHDCLRHLIDRHRTDSRIEGGTTVNGRT